MPSTSLLPSVVELRDLSDGAQVAAIDASDRVNRRNFTYAITGLGLGGCCFLAFITGFVIFVLHGSTTPAGYLLGAGVLTTIRQFVAARLKSD